MCVGGEGVGASYPPNSVWEEASMGPLREFERHSQHLGTTENCAFCYSGVEVANTSRAYWDRGCVRVSHVAHVGRRSCSELRG